MGISGDHGPYLAEPSASLPKGLKSNPRAQMKKRHQLNRVKILNPKDSGQLFTSTNSAADMVRRGVAIYVTGVPVDLPGLNPGPSIRLINDDERRRSSQAQASHELGKSIVDDRDGVIWWDGCTPGSKTAPVLGVVGSNAFVRPNQVTGYFNPKAFNPDAMRGPFAHRKFHVPRRAKESQ
jgi:hypothetical protein